MRTSNYLQETQNLLTPEIVQLLTCIHEHKGRQDLFLEANTDELKTLVDIAMIQSTGASNRKDLMERCPDISQATIERTLSNLVKEGYIIKVGSGPATAYIRKD